MAAFATVQELEAFWKPLSQAEKTRAASILELASNRIRLMATNQGVELNTEDEVFMSVLKSVVLESTKRAMQTPQDVPPVSDYSQTAGPYSENYKFINPGGDLWFKRSELSSIGLGGQTLGNISSARTDIYDEVEEEAS